jgi:two-component system, NarL family, invasion response regulator UvrY
VSKERLRILTIDDHPLVRRGIKSILSEHPSIDVVGEAENASQGLKKIKNEQWDLVILDLQMPNHSPLDTIRHIKQENPDLPVLVLSMFPEEQYALRALKEGASGYITKANAPEALIAAINEILDGGAYVSPPLALLLAANLRTKPKKFVADMLSRREFAVLCAIAEGKHLNQIGTELNLSPKTISTYRSRILTKLGLSTNVELIRFTFENHLVSKRSSDMP